MKESETMNKSQNAAGTTRRAAVRFRAVAVLVAAALCLLLAPGATASSAGPAWSITATSAPTNFAPGDTSDHISLLVRNTGGAATDGSTITVAAALPASLTATAMSGIEEFTFGFMNCDPTTLICTYSGAASAGDIFVIDITVSVASNAPSSVTSSATVSGGGAAGASVNSPIVVSSSAAPFGIPAGGFSVDLTGPDGSTDLQAGAHPDLTVGIHFNTVISEDGDYTTPVRPSEFEKDTQVALPPGQLGNPQAVPQCSRQGFATVSCPTDTQIGIGVIQVGPANGFLVPIYNVVPQAGDAADFGVGPVFHTVEVHIVASVRTDGDYGVTETSNNIGQAIKISGLTLTFWGIPADPSHDAARFSPGGGFLPGNGGNPIPSTSPPAPLLMNPTRCTGSLSTTLSADSWEHPGRFVSATSTTPTGFTGCDALSFMPSLSVQPDTTQAGSPSGYTVDMKVPQALAPTQLSTPTLRNATVTLPEGVVVSPGQADGLGACPLADDGVGTPGPPRCDTVAPNSKIGSVEITTPLLPDRLKGSIYLLRSDPPNLKLLLAASADGVGVKLPGDVTLDGSTGQITAKFDNNPQLPFSDLVLHFNGGPRAALANPRTCGTFTTTSDLEPWSAPASGPDAVTSDSFQVTGCGDPNKFGPFFTAGVQNVQAGASSPFVLSFSRADADQELSSLSATLPPGLLAKIAGVPLCSDADANAGTCPADSQVGKVEAGAGAGSQPLFLPGKAYLTGPYHGAPFGLAVVVPAIAGPFNLGNVVVRQSLEIDPTDAHVTVKSDPFPTILDGIPLQVRRVDVTVNRPGFMQNPTSCDPMQITGLLTSVSGLTAPVSSRFQVGGCSDLGFAPKLSIRLSGGKSQMTPGKHPSLTATLTQPAGQANIRSVKVALPLSLALDPNNSQHVCDHDAAAAVHGGAVPCPATTIVGTATAATPLLPHPVSGNVYLVQGIRTTATGRKVRTLPTLLLPLRGPDGVALDLRASSAVVANKLVTTFAAVPDAPVSKFTLNITGGSNGILTVTGNSSLCSQSKTATTDEIAQSGKENTPDITLGTPCGKAKKHHKKHGRHR